MSETSGLPSSELNTAPSLTAHFHASRLRHDTWTRLKSLTQRLTERGGEAGLLAEVESALGLLEPIERYWAFPGHRHFAQLQRMLDDGDYRRLGQTIQRIVRALDGDTYRRRHVPLLDGEQWDEDEEERDSLEAQFGFGNDKTLAYFEVVVVDQISPQAEEALRHGLRAMRRPEDSFHYEIVVVPSFEDAVIAVLFNTNVQSVVIRYGFPFRSRYDLGMLSCYLEGLDQEGFDRSEPDERAEGLARLIANLRPELDLYLVTDASVEDSAGLSNPVFRRVFYRQEDYLELHLSLLRGVRSRYKTPFFNALREYAEQPTGVFHAMPISRGKSILKSHWIQDMAAFYGINIFLAETSSTSGGLDSLLDPHGTIKEAQQLVARAFGSRRSYFITNGTTAANKIVVQGLVRPDDIVLVDRDCHKSHHYALMLTGASVVYMDAYPLHDFSMYGAVPISEIRDRLLELKEAGQLERVRLVILTNCTFDGIVYHPERVMEQCLAIKPDLIFLWDEAWFGFARFSPTYRPRTAMESAQRLRDRYRSAEYRERYERAEDRSSLPDPDRVRVRVYATQSTHKTLTALRQGSMIHSYDQEFHSVEDAFRDAYMTHTSTSPNYQILASLDIGRRQVELEGFELVSKQVELAMLLREKVHSNELLQRWFRFLTLRDLIPEEHRPSGATSYSEMGQSWGPMIDAWQADEFVLDPTRLTLHIGKTGIDGDTFKKDHLMARHGIQVNKTSRNTVLFMTNIGTSRSSVAHLLDALVRLANEFEKRDEEESGFERRARERQSRHLNVDLPPLPDFSCFHEVFRNPAGTPDGDLRRAFFLGNDEANCEYFPLDEREIDREMDGGRAPVSAGFVTPYPPGFPILVPGQVVSREILAYMRALDTKEIHGFRPELGLRVLTQEALEQGDASR